MQLFLQTLLANNSELKIYRENYFWRRRQNTFEYTSEQQIQADKDIFVNKSTELLQFNELKLNEEI